MLQIGGKGHLDVLETAWSMNYRRDTQFNLAQSQKKSGENVEAQYVSVGWQLVNCAMTYTLKPLFSPKYLEHLSLPRGGEITTRGGMRGVPSGLRVAVAHEGAITFHLSVTPHASLAHALRPHPQRSAGCAGAGQEGMTSKCQSRFECSYHALGHAEAGLCRRVWLQ